MKATHFSADIQDFLILLFKYQVKYLIIGGEAVIYYGSARLTGDIDIYFEISEDNVSKLFKMLNEFWQGDIPGIYSEKELLESGVILQFGVPPNRIDLINKIEQVAFDEAWWNRTIEEISRDGEIFALYFIGLEQLVKNKKALNRPKDQEDLKYLIKIQKS
jgi:hypothetical protein